MSSRNNAQSNLFWITIGIIVGLAFGKVTKRISFTTTYRLMAYMPSFLAGLTGFTIAMLSTFGLFYCVGLEIYARNTSSEHDWATLFLWSRAIIGVIAGFTLYYTVIRKPKFKKFLIGIFTFTIVNLIAVELFRFNLVYELANMIWAYNYALEIYLSLSYLPVLVLYWMVYSDSEAYDVMIKGTAETNRPADNPNRNAGLPENHFYFDIDKCFRNIKDSAKEFAIMNRENTNHLFKEAHTYLTEEQLEELSDSRHGVIVFTCFNLAWLFAFINNRTEMTSEFGEEVVSETINAVLSAPIIKDYSPWRENDAQIIRNLSIEYLNTFIDCYNNGKSFAEGGVADKPLRDFMRFNQLDESHFASAQQETLKNLLLKVAEDMKHVLINDVKLRWIPAEPQAEQAMPARA